MPLAVLRGHVDSQSHDEMIAGLVATTMQQVIDGLTRPVDPTVVHSDEPSALDVVASGDVDEINRVFVARGWSDGLPIVPPTRERVEAFIAASGHDPWRVLGLARPSGRDITVWSVAVNGVMAGCLPEHLPVLLAVAEVIADPHYGVEHSGNTTGADALIVLNGFAGTGLGFNSGQGALRDGVQANTAVGRWLRLYLRNVCGFTADEHDKATFGNTFKVVLAEDEAALAEIGWQPLSADFGFGRGDDVVTMGRINSGLIVGSVFGSTPDEIVPYLADGLTRVTGWDLTHVFGLGRAQYRPLLVLSPLIARTFARSGWGKDELRAALAVEPDDAQVSTLRAVRDLVYELAGAQNRDLAVDVLIYATGVAEFDLTSLRDYARKHGLTPEGFRQHVLKLQRRLGLPPRAMQHSDAN
jgi:hypothetical protein